MVGLIVRRLLIAIPTLIISTLLVFVLVANAGDPLEDLRLKPNVAPAQIHQRAHELGLDKPVLRRYTDWVTHFVKGDFGKDRNGLEVRPQLTKALWVTLRLVLVAEILAVFAGLIVGVFSAVRQYTLFDYLSTGLSFLFYAMPVFWFAVLLKQFGAIQLNDLLERHGHARWIGTIGYETPNFVGSFMARIGDAAGHFVLPTITLTAISYAGYSRFTRASMLDVLSSDYVRTARAKGIPERRVLLRHAFRNALIPVTTVIALDFGALLGGAIITEFIFAWKGMGSLFIESLSKIDPNKAMAWLMITAITVVVFNIIADVLYGFLDPRIRVG